MQNISKNPSKVSCPRDHFVLGSPYPSHFKDIEQAYNEVNLSGDAQVSGVTAAATVQAQVGSHIRCTNTRLHI
jgi:hypothetical protein